MRFVGAIVVVLVGGKLDVLASEVSVVLRYVVYETKDKKEQDPRKAPARTIAPFQLDTKLDVPYSGKARIGTQELSVSGILRPIDGVPIIECEIDASFHHDVAGAPYDVERVQTRIRLEKGKESSLAGFASGAFVLIVVDKGK